MSTQDPYLNTFWKRKIDGVVVIVRYSFGRPDRARVRWERVETAGAVVRPGTIGTPTLSYFLGAYEPTENPLLSPSQREHQAVMNDANRRMLRFNSQAELERKIVAEFMGYIRAGHMVICHVPQGQYEGYTPITHPRATADTELVERFVGRER